MLNQAGLPVTLAVLEDMAGRWAANGEGPLSPLWREAHDLAGCMLSTWPTQGCHERESNEPGEAGRMLAALARLKDTARIETFVSD